MTERDTGERVDPDPSHPPALVGSEARRQGIQAADDLKRMRVAWETIRSLLDALTEAETALSQANDRAFQLAARLSFLCSQDIENTEQAARAVLLKQVAEAETALAQVMDDLQTTALALDCREWRSSQQGWLIPRASCPVRSFPTGTVCAFCGGTEADHLAGRTRA